MSNVREATNIQDDIFEVGEYYAYKQRIGKGAFSTIYKGYHKVTKREVAIKKMEVNNINQIKKNIKTEINVMKKLQHPNIIQLYDVVLDDKYHNVYLILEYCSLGDFYQFQQRRAIQEIHVQKYMRQLTSGLKYLTENKIMHRDLKPQNILVSQSGDIKLTDFGFAKIVDMNTMVNTFCGSPLYMAPEIIKSRGNYTVKSDLWSVGIILYEMLTGYPPFYVKKIGELVQKIDEKDIIIPRCLNISSECQSLLFSLLEPNPKKRISWEDFFAHEWLQKDLLTEEENKLLAFDIDSKGFTVDLPSISQYKQNTKIFTSTHLTESEKKRFQLNDSNASTSISIPNKSSQDYIVVGTPPDRAIEKERMKQVALMIEQKVESNAIKPRQISEVFHDYQKNNDESDSEDLFYSCGEPEHEENNDIEKQLQEELLKCRQEQVKRDIGDAISSLISDKYTKELNNEQESNLSFDFNDLFENENENLAEKLVADSNNYCGDYFGPTTIKNTKTLIKPHKFNDSIYEFSTSLISTGDSLVADKSEPFIVIQTPPNKVTRSDQAHYRKKNNKAKGFLSNFVKGSIDYINSYTNSV